MVAVLSFPDLMPWNCFQALNALENSQNDISLTCDGAKPISAPLP